MSKKINHCNNDELRELLIDRDEIYNSILLEDHDFGDEELAILSRVDKLLPFEKDLLYLSSRLSVQDLSRIYLVSKTHLYNQLRNIQKKLRK